MPKFIKVKPMTDDSGHNYLVPNELADEFTKLLEGGEDTEQEFNDKFDIYATGGSLDCEYQLYIED